jgi:probable F420-dependent oxidoreductase
MASIVPEGSLAIGMQLPIQSQSKFYVEPWEEGAGSDELGDICRKADEIGLFYVAVCDHVAVPRENAERMQTTWYDTIATLGWIAGITEHVRLLSHVFVVPYRHPLLTSKAFSTLDELSGGRAVLGVGAGHVEGEFDLLGVDFGNRGALTDEAVDAIRIAFDEEYPEFHGETWNADGDAGARPRPRQEHLPIWIGGSSKPALRRAATRGDGWLPQGTPRDQMPGDIAYLMEHRAAAGKADDPIDIGTIAMPYYVGEPDWDVGPYTLTGPGEKHVESLLDVHGIGVNHVQVRFRSRSLNELLDQMDAFRAEVMPHLPEG